MQFKYSSIDSTNLEAIRWAECNESVENVWFTAQQQTHGLGQRNRTWSSPIGGLYTSVLYKPPVSLSTYTHQGLISIVAGNVAYEVIRKLLIQNGVVIQPLKIHWPNDIYYQERKLSGILTQGTALGRLVTGFGINVNATISFTGGIEPISLQEITHKKLDLSVIQSCLQVEWQRQLELADQFVRNIAEDYITQTECKLAWIGESVTVINTDESRQIQQTGILCGLTPQGALRLLTSTGEQTIVSGSIRKDCYKP